MHRVAVQGFVSRGRILALIVSKKSWVEVGFRFHLPVSLCHEGQISRVSRPNGCKAPSHGSMVRSGRLKWVLLLRILS